MLAQSVLTLMNGHHEGQPAHESFCPTITHLSRTRQKTTIGTAAGQAVSEPRGLPIDAPDVAQGVADLAQRGLGPNRIKHGDRKSTRLNSSHLVISYAVFCLKK